MEDTFHPHLSFYARYCALQTLLQYNLVLTINCIQKILYKTKLQNKNINQITEEMTDYKLNEKHNWELK